MAKARSGIEYKTLRDLWAALQRLHSAQTTTRILQLRGEIHNTRKERMNIHDYYHRMKTLVEDIRVVGNNVSDDELVL